MRAARLHAVGDLRVADEPEPEGGPGMSLVRVTAVGICGSDLHWWDEAGIGDAIITRPLVLGHEAAGVIEAGPRRGTRVADPVAHFHLANGARLERVNWLGDISASGLQRSAGLTANYVYKLSDVERNHELYVGEHKIRTSRDIELLAKRFVPPTGF